MYSDYMSVALGRQREKRNRRVILSTVTCLVPPHFSTLHHKRHEFPNNVY